MYSLRFFLFLLLAFTFSCQNDKATESTSTSIDEVSIRLAKEPGQISPFFAPTTIGRHVYQYVFLPLADYHPETLELYPILIKEIPKGYSHTLEDGRIAMAFDIEFKEDAQWSDGHPVTAEDYKFTINMVKHPLTKAIKWQQLMTNIYDIKVDKNNSKKMTVYCNPDYMLGLEVVITSYLLPEHIYDSASQLDLTDTTQTVLMDKISASINERKEIIQVGPYVISDEATDEYIILSKKTDYWGANYPDNPFLQSNPNKIIFKVVPDELTATTMAKDGQLDLVELKSSATFLDLRDNHSDKFTFHTPQLMFFYYIAINNTSPKVNDKNVRRALAHLMDVDDAIQTLDKGLGVRNTGPFHPTKPYYNHKLKPIELNIEKAKTLLDESGWIDTDGDNIRDKVINGKKTQLILDFVITGSALSKNIVLLYQEGAAKAGVGINIISKANSLMQKEHINVLKYDMAALAKGFDASPDDPYSAWHSDNADPGGTNKTGYRNPISDDLIETIRNSSDANNRKGNYLKLQEKIYEDQPMIFLYSPLMKFVINNKIAATTTSKRPGYLANTFKNKETE